MRRVLIATTMAASFFATNLLAAEATSPLAPGKPAGVKQAQDIDYTTVLWVAGGAAAVALFASSLDQGGGVHLPTSTAGLGGTSTTTT